jgi:hypothetical protein
MSGLDVLVVGPFCRSRERTLGRWVLARGCSGALGFMASLARRVGRARGMRAPRVAQVVVDPLGEGT